MSGEVVTGTEERLVTGDAVNVAARLEQAAAPGEVLMLREHRRVLWEAFAAHGGVEVDLVTDDGYVGGDVHRTVTSPPAATAATSSLRHHCRPRAAK
jgi:class 3 adenylate cyclase